MLIAYLCWSKNGPNTIKRQLPAKPHSVTASISGIIFDDSIDKRTPFISYTRQKANSIQG